MVDCGRRRYWQWASIRNRYPCCASIHGSSELDDARYHIATRPSNYGHFLDSSNHFVDVRKSHPRCHGPSIWPCTRYAALSIYYPSYGLSCFCVNSCTQVYASSRRNARYHVYDDAALSIELLDSLYISGPLESRYRWRRVPFLDLPFSHPCDIRHILMLRDTVSQQVLARLVKTSVSSMARISETR